MKAWDKWAEIKENTQKKLSNVITKKNIISLNILPRKFIIPLNRNNTYDTKWLQLEMGNISLKKINFKQKIYKERNEITIEKFNLTFFENLKNLQNNDNLFKIIYDTKIKVWIAFLPKDIEPIKYPSIKLFIDIQKVNFQMNEYIYALFLSINKILT